MEQSVWHNYESNSNLYSIFLVSKSGVFGNYYSMDLKNTIVKGWELSSGFVDRETHPLSYRSHSDIRHGVSAGL